MGFFSRMLVPRSVRRAVHPVRTVKSAATPRVVKRARSALNPIDTITYEFERNLNTKPRRRSSALVYRHGNCPVKHRTPEAADRCRNR
jgi:hypothetical protein